MEYNFTLSTQIYVLAGYFLAVCAAVKLLDFYIKAKIRNWRPKPQKNSFDERQEQELQDLLNYDEVKPYATKAKNLFNSSMKSGTLSREQIFYIIRFINRCLGIYAQDYKNIKFTNESHEIYTKLSSTHLSISNLVDTIHVLETFRKNNVIELRKAK
ncbi:MAG: hypothetical protein ABF633_01610 [Clostridium sp.]|uniref:hypothetical protein n=1 Tax=Clostridium sp. TaxID=1506 RepID=UPI0039ED630F